MQVLLSALLKRDWDYAMQLAQQYSDPETSSMMAKELHKHMTRH